MSDVIKLLPDSVANQIAAGEVIQRPSSVVKELVENSVDAGADRIQIILKDAGRTLIQVVDNGCGMTPTDARLAFERHATSKITHATDLFSLHTMGFRGEALASICAVSQVELLTMPRGEVLGTKICINASEFESQEPASAAPGSSLSVKNLFYNIPARRKFLKKDSVEMSNIIHEFERLSLVNPEVEFELVSDGKLLHKLMKGPLKQRIGELFGKTVERQLIPVNVKTSMVSVDGFVGLPENARRRNALQYLFVNGRNMRHPYFHKAVMTCYEKLISPEVQPNYFISFTVDPSTIDVNIHPTKNEIKFENEAAIWQILVAAIRNALGKYNVAPSLDFDIDSIEDIPPFLPDADAPELKITDSDFEPFVPDERGTSSGVRSVQGQKVRRESSLSSAVKNWEALYEDFKNDGTPDSPTLRESAFNSCDFDDLEFCGKLSENKGKETLIDSEVTDDLVKTKLFQYGAKYIVTPVKSGIMIVDQHRAHLLVLYNRYLKNVSETGPLNSQRLIFPELLQLTASQNIILDSIADIVSTLGFDISFVGDNCWTINGIPAITGKMNPRETLEKLIDDVGSMTDGPVNDMLSKVALAMARASAIRGGQILSPEEMDTLLGELLALHAPGLTPDGQTVLSILSSDEIFRRF